jgi:O-antigen ligase
MQMEAISTLPRPALLDRTRKVDWNAISTWLLGFGLVAYLGLKGGGFDPLVHDQIGIAVWWVAFAGLLVGAFPRRRLGPLAWCALGLFAAFVVWTALSLGWTESTDRTVADLARVAGYLGIFALALFIRGSKAGRRVVAAVGAGIAFVAFVALLSRLHPAWFPSSEQTARLLPSSQDRLSYPLDYWNGLAALVAIGLPLILQVATCAKSALSRAIAAAALPAMALTIFFTLSRGGMAAAVVALAIFLALTSDRLPKFLTLCTASVGATILVVAAAQRDALQHGLFNAAAHHQGNEMLAMTIVVCAGVGLVQAGISLPLIHGLRPQWTLMSSRQARVLSLAGLLVVLIAAAAFNVPGRASHAWSDFKQVDAGPGRGASRLSSVAGESRYQFWSAAVKEDQTKPLTGTGSGTFEYWWARNGDTSSSVHDTHSLYLQTLGELGIVGLALLGAFLLAFLVGGTRATLRAGQRGRPQLAAALAGCAAFCITAAFDWMWQIPVLPVATLLLASALVTTNARPRRSDSPVLRFPLRVALSVIAIAAIIAIAIPLASETVTRQSQSDVQAGRLTAALSAAQTAQNVEPGAAAPRLQRALVLEAEDNLTPAALAARGATERESTNWRNWLVLSRIEAERGRAVAAVHAYRRARSLNPNSSLFSH